MSRAFDLEAQSLEELELRLGQGHAEPRREGVADQQCRDHRLDQRPERSPAEQHERRPAQARRRDGEAEQRQEPGIGEERRAKEEEAGDAPGIDVGARRFERMVVTGPKLVNIASGAPRIWTPRASSNQAATAIIWGRSTRASVVVRLLRPLFGIPFSDGTSGLRPAASTLSVGLRTLRL